MARRQVVSSVSGNQSGENRKHVTIRDVAKASYTSISTVSLALSGRAGVAPETRANILAVADRLGWRPDRHASSLRRQNSRLIGLVCQVEQVFQMGLVDSLYVAARSRGLELVLAGATRHHDEHTCVDELVRERCQAMILTGSDLTEEQMSEVGQRLPTVSLGRLVQAPRVNVVVSDDRMGLGQAIDHLVSLGHHRIVHVDGGPAYPLGHSRADAYASAMADTGLADHVRIISGGSTLEHGVDAARQLLATRPLPTAVVCFNDMVAAALTRELERNGVGVPQDVSVVGFDDCSVAADPSTPLTTIAQDPQLLAEATLDLLDAALSDAATPDTATETAVVIPTRLHVRSTTGPVVHD